MRADTNMCKPCRQLYTLTSYVNVSELELKGRLVEAGRALLKGSFALNKILRDSIGFFRNLQESLGFGSLGFDNVRSDSKGFLMIP